MSSHNDRPFRRPQQQGRVDGMCAIYAAVNAAKLLFNHDEKQDEALLKHLCISCPNLFPAIVFEGTGVVGVRSILAATSKWVEASHPGSSVKFSTPYMRVKFETLEGYLGALRAEFGRHATYDPTLTPPKFYRLDSCWLVGLGAPWDHWTCIRDFSDKLLYFYDSYGMRRYRHDSFTIDKRAAGEGPGKKILFDYHQSFLVRRVEVQPASSKHPLVRARAAVRDEEKAYDRGA